jgi:hypothetical protein
MNNKTTIVAALIMIMVLAWWFRYDTNCGGPHACITYDRFTGQWFFSIRKVNDE